MWEPSHKVEYMEPEELSKQYTELAEEHKTLLKKMESITKLVENAISILLSYNTKLADQTKKELEKINEETDDNGDEPSGDSP